MIYITPLLMIFCGYLWIFRYPSKVNNYFGYRTKRSKLNQQTWVFAQKTYAISILVLGIISLILTILLKKYGINLGIIFIQIILFLLVHPITELCIIINFDNKGNKKGE